jgi:microcystin-dependent protein
MLVLKIENTLARALFDTIVSSTSSALPLASATVNGMLRQVSGKTTDFVDGTNNCQPISAIIPPGAVVAYAGPNIPAGWLFCDGSAVSRTTYANLFAAIGGYYGAGDGSTTFNLPNCVGRFIGHIAALAAAGGAPSVALAVGHLPSHAHSIVDQQHAHGYNVTVFGQGGNQVAPQGGGLQINVVGAGTDFRYTGINTTQAIGSGAAFSIIPPYISMYYIIKY